jgi:Xaa-Pro aminopeptidase
MTDFLFHGDTERSAAMRHELPVSIGDPFLLGIVGGRMQVMASTLERTRIAAAAPDAVLHEMADLGFYELLETGMSYNELDLELTSRAAAAMGVGEAIVDPEMPVVVADRLRADGIVLHPDHEAIAARRRVKSAAELDGIRRAQAAAEAGMAAAAALLREAAPDGERLVLGGDVLTAEAVRAVLRDACQRHGAPAPPDVIVASVWQGFGHEAGAGPLPANLPIAIDLWPRDEQSGCWADMTRTFVVGEIGDATRALETLVREAIELARETVRPGVTGRELHAMACDVFESAEHRTQRTGPGEEDPNEGFQFSLGHGVGLQVHEDPALGQTGHGELVAGDVIAIEPGLWQRDVGEVRFEDLLLVTDDGSETLTRYPYELTP